MVDGMIRPLYYRKDAEENDKKEILYSYFIPKNISESYSKSYDVYYVGDRMSMVSVGLTKGLTVYYSKTNDIKSFVIDDINDINNNETITAGNTTNGAILTGKSYTILHIDRTTEEDDDNSDDEDYIDETITIDSSTGEINTTSSTPIGIYTIYIRNTGSYNITIYTLIVTGESSTIIPGLQKVLINSVNNGDNIVTDAEIKLFNRRYIKINDQYKGTSYTNLIRDIHRNELNKLTN